MKTYLYNITIRKADGTLINLGVAAADATSGPTGGELALTWAMGQAGEGSVLESCVKAPGQIDHVITNN